MKIQSTANYSRDFHTLGALITHLSATHWKNRTPSEIATSLAMEHSEVERVLLAYPCFFRQSKNLKPETKELLFTVHMRYALRRRDKNSNNYDEPLSPEQMTIMFNLLAEMIRVEREDARLTLDINHRTSALKWTSAVALTVAILSSATALVVAISSNNTQNQAKLIKLNQQAEPIVTTPVEKVETQGTQAHP